MTKIASKSSHLELEIASVFTDIAQVYQFSGPGPEVGTFKSSDLLQAGAGDTYLPTGYVEPGQVNFSLFMDPVGVTLQALTDLLTTPAVVNWKEVWSDAANTEWPFAGILLGLDPQVDMADGLKADCSIQLSGLVSYPT